VAGAEEKLDVRVEDGWFASYVDGHRVARFGTRQAAEAACRRMQRPEGRTAKHPGFVMRQTPKVART
jgi:hypothetical protein